MRKKSDCSILSRMPVQLKRMAGFLIAAFLFLATLISYKQAMLELDNLVL